MSIFTKKHYKAIAELLRKQDESIDNQQFYTGNEAELLHSFLNNLVIRLQLDFEEDNERFDRCKFKGVIYGVKE